MMHRYVALISTRPEGPAFEQLLRQLLPRVTGWTQTLATTLAAAWVFRSPPSQLGHRPLTQDGCLIGADFGADTHDPATLLERTWGAYLAITVDRAHRSVTVLRDPTGRVECWRISLDGADVLFSHYSDVYWLQARQSPVNWDYIAHHLNQDYLHGETTGLADITELLPGEELRYLDGQTSKRIRWWPDKIASEPHATVGDAQVALRRSAEAGVTAWASRYERITHDLSGGLDSAIVLGLLKQCAGHRDVLALNRMTPGGEGDERSYARAAAAMYEVELIEQEPKSSDVDLTTPFPRRLMRPRARILPLGYDEIGAEIAQRYCADAFFTGTGGDHLFFDNLPITAAVDYLHHTRHPWGYFATAVHLAQLSKDTVWGVTNAVVHRYVSGKPRLHHLAPLNNVFLSEAAREAADCPRYMHPWAIAAAASAPPAKLKQILNMIELHRHYYRYGRADVAEETHPLFSQPGLEACLRTPAHWFGIGGVQRGLARRAFADLLPESIRTRRSKGGNTTYWIQFLTKRLPRIRELLLDGRLAERGLLDRARVERALTPLAVAAGKEFPAINVCLPAELWVRQAEFDIASAEAECANQVLVGAV